MGDGPSLLSRVRFSLLSAIACVCGFRFCFALFAICAPRTRTAQAGLALAHTPPATWHMGHCALPFSNGSGSGIAVLLIRGPLNPSARGFSPTLEPSHGVEKLGVVLLTVSRKGCDE